MPSGRRGSHPPFAGLSRPPHGKSAGRRLYSKTESAIHYSPADKGVPVLTVLGPPTGPKFGSNIRGRPKASNRAAAVFNCLGAPNLSPQATHCSLAGRAIIDQSNPRARTPRETPQASENNDEPGDQRPGQLVSWDRAGARRSVRRIQHQIEWPDGSTG